MGKDLLPITYPNISKRIATKRKKEVIDSSQMAAAV